MNLDALFRRNRDGPRTHRLGVLAHQKALDFARDPAASSVSDEQEQEIRW